MSMNRSSYEPENERASLIQPTGIRKRATDSTELTESRSIARDGEEVIASTSFQSRQTPTTDDQPQQSDCQASPAERQMLLSLCSVLVLAIGVSLQVYLFIKFSSTTHDSQHLDDISQLVFFSNIYNFVCMLVSTLWTCSVFLRSCRGNINNQTQSSQAVGHDGSYLIYGLVFFAIGGALLVVFQAMALWTYPCSNSMSRVYVIMKVIFIVLQTCTICIAYFRRGSVISSNLADGALLYLTVVTNVSLYLTTILESKKQFVEIGEDHSNATYNWFYLNCSSSNPELDDLFGDASVYLYPFFLEFTLTASGMLAEFWMANENHVHVHSVNSRSTPSASPGNSQTRKLKLTAPMSIAFTILGCFAFVIIILHYLSDTNYPGHIFHGFNIIVSTISSILCLIGIMCLSPNVTVKTNVGFDEILLIISIFGVFGICICGFSSGVNVLCSNKHFVYAWLKLVGSVMWVTEAALQAWFTTKALHRKPREVKKCGIFNIGYLSVILAAINLGVWLLNTIDLEGHYRSLYSKSALKLLNDEENKLFGQATWTWIMLVLYPLAIFFRIHSVLTLFRVFRLHKHLPVDQSQVV